MLLRNRDSVESLNTVDFDIPKTSHDSGSLVEFLLLL